MEEIFAPTKDDFKALNAEVKETCRAEIATVRQDLKEATDRIETLEDDHDATRRYVLQLQLNVSSKGKQLCDVCRHLKDIDNQAHRNNIRVRGLPEAKTEENLPVLLESVFNRSWKSLQPTR